MKKYIRNLALLPAALCLLASCLKDDMDDRVPEDNFYKTEQDAQMAINGVYSTLYSFQYLKWNWPIAHAAFEDGMFTGDNSSSGMISKNITSANIAELTGAWESLYPAINAANSVLAYVPAIPFEDENVRNRILAEAHFLRAYYYYDLIRCYGGVDGIPLHKDPVKSLTQSYMPDSATWRVYNLILDDLTWATGTNPDGSTRLPLYKSIANQAGKVTNGAAHAYLAEVHLTLGEWENAIAHANVVINSRQYALTADYERLWNVMYKNVARDEKIFYVPCYNDKDATQDQSLGTALAWLLNPSGVNADGTGVSGHTVKRGQGFRRVEKWFIHFFNYDVDNLGYSDPTKTNSDADLKYHDYRIETSFWRYYKKINDNTLVLSNGAAYPCTETYADNWGYIRKYIDPNGVANRTNANDVVRMRLADMYLILAEAYNELGDYEKACAALDEVRKRARMADGTGERDYPKLLSQTADPAKYLGRVLTQQQFRWLVFMERGLEFAGEWKRFFDLKRIKYDENSTMYDYMMNTYLPTRAAAEPGLFSGLQVLSERKKFWPKPKTEVDRNPGVHQNQGY